MVCAKYSYDIGFVSGPWTMLLCIYVVQAAENRPTAVLGWIRSREGKTMKLGDAVTCIRELSPVPFGRAIEMEWVQLGSAGWVRPTRSFVPTVWQYCPRHRRRFTSPRLTGHLSSRPLRVCADRVFGLQTPCTLLKKARLHRVCSCCVVRRQLW